MYEIFVTKKSVVLKFTYIGFKTSEIRTNASTNIYDVTLEEQVNELEETVIVGYGTQRKISNIGAQSSMKMEDIKTPSASLTTTLAGRLAGVVAVQRTGEPGKDAADIWIRGISTPNTSSPLVLVDGVERSFNDIDPEDIESLTTLKDASATAVYGVRGANGVILIKTKPGKVGKPTVSADYYESFTRFTKMVDLADGITYMNAANEAMRNDGIATKYTEDQIRNTIAGKDSYLYPNVDWLKEIFNDWGHNRRVNVNVRGGSEKVSYYASVSYFNETGMTVTDKSINTFDSKMKYSRYNFTTNLSIDVTPTTKVEIGAQGYLGEGTFLFIKARCQPKQWRPEELDVKITSMELLPDVKEKLVEKITILIPLSALNSALVAELSSLTKDHPGNTELYFKVTDKDEKMVVDLISRPVKLSVGRELISYLKERPELEFRIN